MLVYRVEDADKYGIYCGDWLPPGFGSKKTKRHPMPYDDAKLCATERFSFRDGSFDWDVIYARCREYHQVRYGFVSLEQLKFWLYKTSWRKRFKEHGFHVSVYECEIALAGDTQAVFSLDGKVELQQALDLVTFEPIEEGQQ